MKRILKEPLFHFLLLGVRVKRPAPRWAQLIPPYAIGGLAMFWVIQRIAAF